MRTRTLALLLKFHFPPVTSTITLFESLIAAASVVILFPLTLSHWLVRILRGGDVGNAMATTTQPVRLPWPISPPLSQPDNPRSMKFITSNPMTLSWPMRIGTDCHPLRIGQSDGLRSSRLEWPVDLCNSSPRLSQLRRTARLVIWIIQKTVTGSLILSHAQICLSQLFNDIYEGGTRPKDYWFSPINSPFFLKYPAIYPSSNRSVLFHHNLTDDWSTW